MDAEPRGAHVAAHVKSIRARTHLETEQLASRLVARSWPGRSADRIDPAAVEWLRRWGPSRLGVPELDCSCPAGRCAACN